MSLALKREVKVNEMKRYILNDYNNFLEDKKGGSIHTYTNYKKDLEYFFKEVYGKKPEFVVIEDLENTTGNDMVEYRNELREYYKDTTVNRRINSVRSFFNFMATDNKNVRTEIFNKVKRLKENDKKGYDSLTLEEVNSIIGLAESMYDKELSLLFELAFVTAIRLEALLELTYDKHFYQKDEDGELVWFIETIDKGEIHVKSISNELKGKLDVIADNHSERIFKSYYKHKVGVRLKTICDLLEIDKRRNVRFHSFKKASINFVIASTGDLKQAQQQGNHKSAQTTLDSYVKANNKLTQMASYNMNREIDISPLWELTKEELIKLIEESSASTRMELLKKVKK